MSEILFIKTGALGDVLRTTSVLPGLLARHPDAHVTWLTARGAVDLVRLHPLIAEVVPVDLADPASLGAAGERLARTAWERVLSFDDELPLCRLASSLQARQLSGAHLDGERRVYTTDVAPWFDMGLLSVHGKERADRLKVENTRSHPEIFAAMLGVEMDRPRLEVEPAQLEFARALAAREGLHDRGPVVGLNTGAGGRWSSKTLSVEKTAALVGELHRRLDGRVAFLLLGGRDEAERNAAILAAARGALPELHLVDGGTDNPLLEFAALVDRCDLLLTSDSLALHVGVARGVRIVSFFAPTSAAEIELYGLGEKVVSTSPDYCSYRAEADTSTLTVERLAEAVLRQLAEVPA